MNAFKTIFLTFLFVISGTAGFCFENDDAALLIADKLQYNRDQTEQFWAVSKIWPADKSITIAALLFPNAREGDDAVYYDIDIVPVDTNTGDVIARSLRKRAAFSSAFRLTGVSIDTARYNLTKGVRAFGIRRYYEGSSRYNSASMTVMELFVLSGSELKIISAPLIMEHSTGEWDGECAGEYTDIKRIISIDEKKTKGYYDLKLITAQKDTITKMKGEECAEEIKKLPEKEVIIKFDGNKYKAAKDMIFTE